MATIATEGTTTRNGKFTITSVYDVETDRNTYRHVFIRANGIKLLTRQDQAALRAFARRTVADPKSVGKVEMGRGTFGEDGDVSAHLTVTIHNPPKETTVSTTDDGRTRADFDSLTVTIDGVRRLNNSRDGAPVWLLTCPVGSGIRRLRTLPGAQVGYTITPDLAGETVTLYLDETAHVVFLDRVTA